MSRLLILDAGHGLLKCYDNENKEVSSLQLVHLWNMTCRHEFAYREAMVCSMSWHPLSKLKYSVVPFAISMWICM
jgi:hypothetical protein